MAVFPKANRRNALPALLLTALVLSCPYVIPVFWLSLTRWFGQPLPENPGFIPSPVENHSWYIIFGSIAVIFSTAIYGLRCGYPTLDPYLALTALAWFGYTAVRALFTPGIQWSYLDVLLQVGFLMILLTCLIATNFTSRSIYRFQILGAVAIIPLAGVAIAQNAGHDPLPYSPTMPGSLDVVHGKHVVASTFGHPNYMGSYLAPLMVLCLPLLLGKTSSIARLVGASAYLLGFIALIVGGTRGPLLALAGGTFVFFLSIPRPPLPWRKLLIIAGVGLFVLISAIMLLPALRPGFDIADRLMGSKEIASRAFYWRIGFYAFAENPMFGIGPAQFDRLFWQNVLKAPGIDQGGHWHFVLASIIRGVRPGQLHNDHLQVLVETGLMGAALWAAFWAAIARRGLKLRASLATSPTTAVINSALLGTIAVVAIDGMFGFPLRLPCSGALFWLLIGIYTTWHPYKPAIPSSAL